MPGKIRIIGVPLDLGANRRGTDMGPSAMRYAGLGASLERLGYEVVDSGNLAVAVPETRAQEKGRARFLAEIQATCRELSDLAHESSAAGETPVIIGGDHSIAMGTIDGLLRAEPGLGVLWFDAHADLNTPAGSPSGNVHGMPLGALLGFGEDNVMGPVRRGPALASGKVVIIGARSLDQGEIQAIRESGVRCFTMHEVDKYGMREVVNLGLDILRGTPRLHVDFDIDALDPAEAPGVGTPVRGGFTYREAHLALELVAATGKLRSIEMVEVNPVRDKGNRTAETAVTLICSALGKRILP